MDLLARFWMEGVVVRQTPAMVPNPTATPIVNTARRIEIDAHVWIIVVIIIAARPGAVNNASCA